MKRFVLVPFLTVALYAAGITGKWTGNIVVNDPTGGDKVDTPVKAELVQQAAAITGKIGRAEDRELETILNGKLEGKSLTFQVKPAEATGAAQFTLTVISDDRIEGEVKVPLDIGTISGTVVLKREK